MSRFLRFFAPEMSDSAPKGAEVLVSGDEAKHATRVLRLEVGHELELFNGLGAAAMAQITSVSKSTFCATLSENARISAPPSNVHLAIAPMKKDFDEVVVRLAELGVAKVTPIGTQFGEVDYSRKEAAKYQERMQRLGVRAAKQSGINHLIEVGPQIPIESLSSPMGAIFMAAPEGQEALSKIELPSDATEIVLLIGPEGGFSAKELAHAETQGWLRVRLAGGVLRAGTAALAAAALVVNRIDN